MKFAPYLLAAALAIVPAPTDAGPLTALRNSSVPLPTPAETANGRIADALANWFSTTFSQAPPTVQLSENVINLDIERLRRTAFDHCMEVLAAVNEYGYEYMTNQPSNPLVCQEIGEDLRFAYNQLSACNILYPEHQAIANAVDMLYNQLQSLHTKPVCLPPPAANDSR